MHVFVAILAACTLASPAFAAKPLPLKELTAKNFNQTILSNEFVAILFTSPRDCDPCVEAFAELEQVARDVKMHNIPVLMAHVRHNDTFLM